MLASRTKFIKKILDHLEESGMSYWQHLLHSFKQSNRLLVIAFKSYLHGVLPWIWNNAGPLGIYRIYKEIRRLHHVQRIVKIDDDSNNTR